MFLKNLFEAIENKTAVLGWGRGMGHKGHMLLAKAVIHHAQENNAKPYFVVSRTSLVDPSTGQPWADKPTFTKTKDDPLSPEEKLATYRKVFPQNADVFSVATADASTLDKVLAKIARDGFDKVILVVGELEKDSFSFLTRPDKSGVPPYQRAGLQDLEIISRQNTSEPSSVKGSPEYQEGPRATPMRAVLKDPTKSEEEQFAVWRDAMPDNLDDDEVMDLMLKAKQRMSMEPAAKKPAKKSVAEAINPDITNPAFSHQQQIGDYLYVARYWSKGLKISAYHGDKQIGYAELMYQTAPFDDFADPKTTPKRVWLESEWTKVNPKYQRQGIMSTMYAYAKMLGNSVKPSKLRSPDAKAAWASWRQAGDAKHLTSNEGVAEGDESQFVAARYIDEFADGDHWYVKGTPEVIQRFVQLANSLEDESVKGTEYEPGKGMMGKIHAKLGNDSIPQWQIVKAQNLEAIKPIGNRVLQLLMQPDLSYGAQEFMSEFLWTLEEKGLALVTTEPVQGVAEGLNEFAPAGRDPWGDEQEPGDDPYKSPKPKAYGRSIDYFGQFEADHFDKHDFNEKTGVFKGYWDYDGDLKQIAYFKFDDPQQAAKNFDDSPGMGWYYEPQNESVAERQINELDIFAPVTTYVRLANGEYVAANWRRNQDLASATDSASFIDVKPLDPMAAKRLGLDNILKDPRRQNDPSNVDNLKGNTTIAKGGPIQGTGPLGDRTVKVVDITDPVTMKNANVPDSVIGKVAQWAEKNPSADQVSELSKNTLKRYVPARIDSATKMVSTDKQEKAKRLATKDIPRALNKLKDQQYGEKGVAEEKVKGVDGKACWKGKRYAGKVKKADGTYKDKCVPVSEGIEQKMASLIKLLENK